MMKVKAHRNLNSPNKRVDWSTTVLSSGSHKGKVLAYAAWLELSDVFFRVQKKGVERIREKGVRSVVAWAEGQLVDSAIREFRYPENDYDLAVSENICPESGDEWVQIRFDAFDGAPAFTVAATAQAVSHADRVILSDTGACFALNPRLEN